MYYGYKINEKEEKLVCMTSASKEALEKAGAVLIKANNTELILAMLSIPEFNNIKDKYTLDDIKEEIEYSNKIAEANLIDQVYNPTDYYYISQEFGDCGDLIFDGIKYIDDSLVYARSVQPEALYDEGFKGFDYSVTNKPYENHGENIILSEVDFDEEYEYKD